jgi:hypothetical protein
MSIDTVLRAEARTRSLGFLVVVALHVALVWLVANGLGLRLGLEPAPPRLQATFEDRVPTEVDPAPLPPHRSPGPAA